MILRVVLSLTALCFSSLTSAAQEPQPPVPTKLNLVVVEGEGAINNIKQRTARETIIKVEDENHRPVAGAVVVFMMEPAAHSSQE